MRDADRRPIAWHPQVAKSRWRHIAARAGALAEEHRTVQRMEAAARMEEAACGEADVEG